MNEQRWVKLAVKLAERNLTMKDLADSSGLHVKSIYRMMKSGPSKTRMESINKIAETLGVDAKELL